MVQPSGSTAGRLTLTEKILAALASLLALGSAALGLWTAEITKAREQAKASVAAKDTDLSALQRQLDQLKSKYDYLQTDNTQLRSRLGLPGSTDNAQPAPDETVRHSGSVTLFLDDNAADLDAPASDPGWSSGDYDIKYIHESSGSFFVVYTPAVVADLGDKEADYSTCRSATNYRKNRFDTRGFAIGNHLCIKTSSARYSALHLTELTAQMIKFDIETYDPPIN